MVRIWIFSDFPRKTHTRLLQNPRRATRVHHNIARTKVALDYLRDPPQVTHEHTRNHGAVRSPHRGSNDGFDQGGE